MTFEVASPLPVTSPPAAAREVCDGVAEVDATSASSGELAGRRQDASYPVPAPGCAFAKGQTWQLMAFNGFPGAFPRGSTCRAADPPQMKPSRARSPRLRTSAVARWRLSKLRAWQRFRELRLTVPEACARVGIPSPTLYRWRLAYRKDGLDRLRCKYVPGPGRPPWVSLLPAALLRSVRTAARRGLDVKAAWLAVRRDPGMPAQVAVRLKRAIPMSLRRAIPR